MLYQQGCEENKEENDNEEVKLKVVALKKESGNKGNLEDEDVQVPIKDQDLSPIEYIHSEDFQKQLDFEYRARLTKLLEQHIDVLATSTEELSPSRLASHRIKLKPGTQPVKQRAYIISKAQSDVLKEEITKLINKGLIEPSESEWSFPVVLVPKKNGKWRMCVDYRKVNNVTIKDAYSLPLIDEIFNSMNGATVLVQ